jgi:hypothetical protein
VFDELGTLRLDFWLGLFVSASLALEICFSQGENAVGSNSCQREKGERGSVFGERLG